MKPLSVEEVISAVSGQCMDAAKETMVHRVVTDSRQVAVGDLYIPIIGENFDGHDFIDDAIANGAVAALSSRPNQKGPIIEVEDTKKALGALAAYHRSRFDIPVIGITGSVGKTSTKEMLASLLEGTYDVHKTAGNFNNDIGLPLTLLGLEAWHQVAIVELGMNHFGEIDYLASLLKPTHGMISNIGVSHIEFLGSREGILKAKMEMVPYIQKGGLLVLNGDDQLLSKVKPIDGIELAFYSEVHQMDCIMTDYASDARGGQSMKAQTMSHVYEVSVDYPGKHILHNGLGCILIAEALGVSRDHIIQGLKAYKPAAMRLNRRLLKDQSLILDDAYNASVDSMESALETLRVMGSAYDQTIAVLGSMFEMGSYAEEGHARVGQVAAQKNIDCLICVGDEAKWIASAAIDAGYPGSQVHQCVDVEAGEKVLLKVMQAHSLVLIKASRGMRLERLRDLLIERFEEV